VVAVLAKFDKKSLNFDINSKKTILIRLKSCILDFVRIKSMIQKRCYIPLIVAFLILLMISCFGMKAQIQGKGKRVLYSSSHTAAQVNNQ